MLGALAPYRWQYIFGICIGLIHVLLDQQGPRFLRAIINSSAAGQVVWTIGFWALAFVGSVLLQRWTILIMTRAGESVQFDFRRRLFDHLQELSMSYYDRTKLGRIISRMTSDIGAMREINVWGIFQVVAWSGMMLFAALMMAILWARHRFQGKDPEPNLHLSVSTEKRGTVGLNDIVGALEKHCTLVSLRRFDESNGSLEADFLVAYPDYRSLEEGRAELRKLDDSLTISLLETHQSNGWG